MKNILVTGSDGYIGSVLVNLLLSKGYKVTGLDCLFFKDIKLGNYNSSYNLIKEDVRLVQMNLSQFDVIVHLAALSNDPLGKINPRLTHKINFLSTIKLAKAARKAGVKKFIFSGSCSLYGITNQDIVDEKSKVNPLTEYAKSKIDSEQQLKNLADENFCVVLMRNSTVYGYSPKFRDDLVVNNLVACASTLGEIKILSDGTPWRPLIDVKDLATIFLEFINLDSSLINSEIFNIGFDKNNFQIKDIASQVQKHLPSSRITYAGKHGNDSRSYRVNFSKFKNLLPNLKQNWPLSKSIPDLIEKLNRYKFTSKDFSTGKFSRVNTLNKLIKQGFLDKDLFWTI